MYLELRKRGTKLAPQLLQCELADAGRVALAIAADLDDLERDNLRQRVAAVDQFKLPQGVLEGGRHRLDRLRIEGGLAQQPTNRHDASPAPTRAYRSPRQPICPPGDSCENAPCSWANSPCLGVGGRTNREAAC